MVEQVGSVKIVGEIDVSSIKAGLESMKNGLDEAKIAARGAFGDLKRTGSAIESIAEPLAAIGVALGTTILGIAALSPAVAPILARMQVDFITLSRVLGDELKPVFEDVASAFGDLVDWMGSDEGIGAINLFGTAVGDLLGFLTLAVIEANKLIALGGGIIAPVIEAGGGLLTPEQRGAAGLPSGRRTAAEEGLFIGQIAVGSALVGSILGPAGALAGGLIGTGLSVGYMIGENLFGPGAPFRDQATGFRNAVNQTLGWDTKQTPSYQNMRSSHIAD